MIEVFGDLWSVKADVVVITTNGMVRNDGACVMGRGTAQQATQRYPRIEFELGKLIRRHGNHCFLLRQGELLSMPVKHHWRDLADVELIERSAGELVTLADLYEWNTVAMPRPGCGNGGLSWVDQVAELADRLLDDRFMIVERQERNR